MWYGEHLPDRDRPELRQEQFGYGVDWTPLPSVQGRLFFRLRDGPLSVPGSRDDLVLIELHLFL